MKRASDLNRATDKAREFLQRGRCSSARSLRPSRRRRPPRSTELSKREAELQERFKLAALAQGCCQSCGYTGAFVDAHHALAKSLLKALLLRKGQPCPLEVVWDPRNAMLLCSEPAPNRCHERHTLAMRRVPRLALRDEHWEFAREHGLDWVLETEYPA